MKKNLEFWEDDFDKAFTTYPDKGGINQGWLDDNQAVIVRGFIKNLLYSQKKAIIEDLKYRGLLKNTKALDMVISILFEENI